MAALYNRGGAPAETLAEKDRRLVGPITDADKDIAAKALAWAISLADKPTKSEFEHNPATLARQERISSDHIGFVAAIIPCYNMAVEREEERAARASKPVSQFVGTPGERRVFTLIIKKIIGIEGFRGNPSNLVLAEDVEGNPFKWKTEYLPHTGERDAEAGDTIILKATIKGHQECTPKSQGALPIKQTVILRGVVEK